MKLKKSMIVMILAIAGGAFLFQGAVPQESAPGLFERAVYLEETKGDLEKAIEVYNAVLKKFAENQPFAAKALYRIGMCHEKLGSQEAQKAYRRLIEQYPGQKEEVALARARLAELTAAAKGALRPPTFRKIRIPANPMNGVLSADGKRLAFISQGAVWILPIPGKIQSDLAGEAVRLTEPVVAWNMGNTMDWSRDGKWIAFNVVDEDETHAGNRYPIYVVSAEGGEPKRIPVAPARGISPYHFRIGLSPDGRILAFSSEDLETSSPHRDPARPHPYFLYTIPLPGGRASQLTDTCDQQPAFSPNGKRIAFARYIELEGELAKERGRYKGELWVIDADGSNPVRLTDSAWRARGPVWSPDGKSIAFIRSIIKPEGQILSHIFVTPFAGGEARQISTESNMVGYASIDWSPDGNWLAYFSQDDTIRLLPAEGGESKLVVDVEGFHDQSDLAWSPDGKELAYTSSGRLMVVPVDGGKPREVKTGILEVEKWPQNFHIDWSPDGSKFVFSVGFGGDQELWLMEDFLHLIKDLK